MRLQHYLILLVFFGLTVPTYSQTPPTNSFLIDSPFPSVHQNNYRQGFSNLPALLDQSAIEVRTAITPNERVSPWLQLSETYPDGSRTIWGCSSTHIWKAISTPEGLTLVSDYQIDFDPTDRSWSFLMLSNKEILTSDDNRLLVFAEENPNDPSSAIYLKREVTVPESVGMPGKFNRLYNGNIAFATNDGLFGLLSPNLVLLDTFQLALVTGENVFQSDETAFHNDYASDENGGVYTVTTRRMIRLDMSSTTISQDWSVEMDFGGTGLQGVGTTPTLLGTTDDRLVCVVNSKTPAEMIAFWRDEIPNDWNGLQGMDPRVAAVVPLPGSSPINSFFAAVENSPVAYGYGIACAQYNGFLGQGCPTAKGVYKLEWNTAANVMELKWHRNDINLNNVLIYSVPDNLMYGSGREDDCNFYYYGLDWNTGNTIKRFPLGAASYLDDPGDANIILEDRSLLVNTRERLVQIYPANDPVLTEGQGLSEAKRYLVYPNPVGHTLTIAATQFSGKEITLTIFDARGNVVEQYEGVFSNVMQLPFHDLAAGLYLIHIEEEWGTSLFKVLHP